MKKIIMLLAILSSIGPVSGVEWTVAAPGGALTNQPAVIIDAPAEPCIRVVFDPSRAEPGDYWCSTRLGFSPCETGKKVGFFLRGPKPGNVCFKLVTDDGRDLYRTVAVTEEWNRIDWNFSTELNAIASFELIFRGDWPAQTVELAGLEFREAVPQPEIARFWMPATLPPPVPGYGIETTIHSCWRNGENQFPGINTPEGRRMALDITRKMQQEFGCVSSVAVNFFNGVPEADAAEFVRDMKSIGVIVRSEGHDAPPQDYVQEHNLYALNNRGERYPDTFHNTDKTNPAALRYLQEKLGITARSGAAVFRSVDFTWQHIGGPIWGYSDAAKQRWKEDLAETDVKLEILLPGNETRKIGFHDYFASYYGFRMTPADCGISDWNEYLPPADGEPDTPALRNRRKLFIALYHYEWLKFLNESVRPWKETGLRAQPTLNPESQYNGTDLYWMLRLSLTSGWCTEWWNTAPVIVPVYYHSNYYGRVAEKYGKEIIHLGETGAAGNGFGTIPNYWDNMANYLVTYAKSAACDAKIMNDQYWAATYETMTNPENAAAYEMYTGFRSAWAGFLQSKNDRAEKPAARVAVIQNRAVMDNIDCFDIGGGYAPLSIASDLIEQNYLYDGLAYPLDDPADLERYDVIVLTAFESPREIPALLRKWLEAKPGRTLITHSDIPNRIAAPVRSLAEADAPFRRGEGAAILGLPELRPGQLREGNLVSDLPALASFNGRKFKLPIPPAEASGGNVLASLGGAPLLSEFPVGKSRILYLHNAPVSSGIQSRALQKALTAAALERAGIRPQATAPASHRVLVFQCGDGRKVLFIIDVQAETAMSRDGKVYRVYQAKNPAAAATVFLAAEPERKYRLTNMITGESVTADSDRDGRLPISCAGWNLLGLYLEPAE